MADKFSPPPQIYFESDGTIAQFQSLSRGTYTYKYIKSSTKLGELLNVTEDQLKQIIKNNDTWKRSKKNA